MGKGLILWLACMQYTFRTHQNVVLCIIYIAFMYNNMYKDFFGVHVLLLC